MKNEIIQPVKHFDMHDDPLTNIETLHLIIWNSGLAIAGYSHTQDVLTSKIYSLEQPDFNTIESIFINEPLVAGPQPITHIWITDERHLIIPSHLFEKQAAEEWLNKFYFLEAESVIGTSILSIPFNTHIVYPLEEKLFLLLNKYFGEEKIHFLSKALLFQTAPVEDTYIDITVLNHTIILSILHNGQLLSHQVFNNTHPADIIYKIASIGNDFKLSQEKMRISLSGFSFSEELASELRAFFPKVTIPGSEQFSSFTLLKKLISCVS